jgi:hypothetical protein
MLLVARLLGKDPIVHRRHPRSPASDSDRCFTLSRKPDDGDLDYEATLPPDLTAM